MISDLIEVASHIKTIYQRLEYLDKKGNKDSIEYKRAVQELKSERKMEEDIIGFQAIYSSQINALTQELKAKYPFLATEVTISSKKQEPQKLMALRIMNELSTIDSTFLNQNGYNNSLKHYLIIDEFMLALSIAHKEGFNDYLYHISYLIPSIEQELLNTDFVISDHPLIYSDCTKNMYNVSDKYHVMYKDNILKEKFKMLIEKIITQSDETLDSQSEYYTFIKYLLRSIMTLSSDNTRLELNALISKYLMNNNKKKASIILEDLIDKNDFDIPLKVTLR